MAFRRLLKVCCVAGLVLVAILGLGPENWQPRSGLGWEIDHFAGYLVIALMFCLAWPRPIVVAPVLIVFACALEALQAIPPDRHSNLFAAMYGSVGVLAGALLAELFIRARRRLQSKPVET